MKFPPKEQIEQVLVRNDIDRGLIDTLLLDYDYGFMETFINRLISEVGDKQDSLLLDELKGVKDELDEANAEKEDIEAESYGLEDENAELEVNLDDAKEKIKKLRKYIITKFDNNYLEGDEDE